MNKSVAMLLSDGFSPDPRVHKEARSLVQVGYRVTVLAWDRNAESCSCEVFDGFDVRRIRVKSTYSAGSRQLIYLPQFWLLAFRELRQLRPDIIHAHDLDTAPLGYFYARAEHIPWIFDAHECYPEQIKQQINLPIYYALRLLEKYMAKSASHVITVGELLAQRFRSFGGTVTVVGNYQTYDGEQGKQEKQRKPHISRAALGIKVDTLVVSYIGAFTLGRAIVPLIEATRKCPDVTVLLAGDGPQRQKIELLLPQHPNVHYLGHVPQQDVHDYLSLSDVVYYGLYATNKNNEYSSPNALFNALVVGKSVLTTNLGEIAHIVQSGRCGIVIDQPEPDLIAEAIERLREPSLRSQMEFNARNLAQTEFNWSIAESKLIDVYGRVLNDGRKTTS